MRYYIWYDEGCCSDTTDDLEVARRIEKELLDDGFTDVYITDENNNVVDEVDVPEELK